MGCMSKKISWVKLKVAVKKYLSVIEGLHHLADFRNLGLKGVSSPKTHRAIPAP
jgi:hypothetical protein